MDSYDGQLCQSRPFSFSRCTVPPSLTLTQELGETVIPEAGSIVCDTEVEGYIFLVLSAFHYFFAFGF